MTKTVKGTNMPEPIGAVIFALMMIVLGCLLSFIHPFFFFWSVLWSVVVPYGLYLYAKEKFVEWRKA